MRKGALLFSAAEFLFAAVVMFAGIFLIALEYAPVQRQVIADFFVNETHRFLYVGLFVVGCGIVLFAGFCAIHRGIYYQVRMGKRDVLVEPAVIQTYAENYWRHLFPEQKLTVQIALSQDQKIEMFVELPPLAFEEQRSALERAERELSQILRKHLGYRKEFLVSVLIK